jgi:hypothetical protein
MEELALLCCSPHRILILLCWRYRDLTQTQWEPCLHSSHLILYHTEGPHTAADDDKSYANTIVVLFEPHTGRTDGVEVQGPGHSYEVGLAW